MNYVPDDYGLIVEGIKHPVFRMPLGTEDERYYHASAIKWLNGRELTSFNVTSESDSLTVDSTSNNGPIVSFRAKHGEIGYHTVKIVYISGDARITRRACVQVI